MSVVVCKHPVVRMDLLFKKAMWPAIVNLINNCGGTYDNEDEITINNEPWIQIHNVESHNWANMGLIMSVLSQKISNSPDKVYILINTKKKGTKNHVEEIRPETDAGSESGDRSEPADNSQQGDNLGSGGDGGSDGIAGISDSGSPEVSETADDDRE